MVRMEGNDDAVALAEAEAVEQDVEWDAEHEPSGLERP